MRNPFLEKIFNWEIWPFWLRYLGIIPVWFWYCLRSGSLWFFTPSNPTLSFGGFEGEGKQEMYDLLDPGLYPKTIYIDPLEDVELIKQRCREAGLEYPFIVKPDIGMKGLLFRKIDHESELLRYHASMPIRYLAQELVSYPLEVSIFYYRYPHQEKGVVSGFIQKDLMDVKGDGNSTLWELIQQHPQAKHRLEEMRIKHAASLQEVIPASERFVLTYAANLNRGARFTDLSGEIDDALLGVFDPISHKAQFYYGRYDIKCRSVAALKEGNHFSILEFNGSGAEPNHVYQTGKSLFAAYRVILHHWKVLFHISRMNHRKGIRYWTFRKGWDYLRAARKHLAVLEKYDREIPV